MKILQFAGRGAALAVLLGSPGLALAAGTTVGQDGSAAAKAIVRANTEAGFGLAGQFSNLGQSGTALSSNGWMPGLTAYARAMYDYGHIQHLYVSVRDQYAWGATHQGGLGSDGGYLHHNVASLRLGKGFMARSDLMLTPYLAVGDRYEDRNFGLNRSVSLHSQYLGGGLMVQYAYSPTVVFAVAGSVGATVNARVNAQGVFGNVDGHVASRLADTVSFSVDDHLARHFHAFGRVSYAHGEYGVADGLLRRNDLSLETGVAYSF